MATYCFRCRLCGFRTESTYSALPNVPCADCGIETLRRDYKAESVGFNGLAQLRKEREAGTDGKSGKEAMRDLFLPKAEDFRSPTDSTGERGMREWNDRHAPRESNKAPLYPEVPKRSF